MSGLKSFKEPSIPWSTRNKSSSSDTKQARKPPASPSPSASVILISPTNQVLLLHRVQTSSSFPSAHVFPGGNLEPSDGSLAEGDTNPARHVDNDAYRIGAIRELFEETGILLARETSSPSSSLLAPPLKIRLAGRKAIHSHSVTIHDWLRDQSASAVLDTDALIPFTRWITPTNVPKRFTTQMYIYFLPLASHLNPAQTSSLLATSDEVETMAPEWRDARDWIARAQSGEIILFPPQFLLLSFVSSFLDLSAASSPSPTSESSDAELESRRERLRAFVNGDGSPPWREKVICPTALSFTRKDGKTVLGLDKPGPELREAKDRRGDDTRVVLVRFSKAGPREVEVRMRKEVLEEERKERQPDQESKL